MTCTLNQGPAYCDDIEIAVIEEIEDDLPYYFEISCTSSNFTDCRDYLYVVVITDEETNSNYKARAS